MVSPHDISVASRPVVFGEVLFDTFPDGTSVLGGAPFNVAWHLQGLGLKPLFVSRVGADDRGEQVRQAMLEWGMDVGGLQRGDHPTGQVRVEFEGGQPAFHIVPDQAYDFIDDVEAEAAVAGVGSAVLYHGSLAMRSATSAAALRAMTARMPSIFVDVNLRSPWWTQDVVESALAGARWAKLNDHELAELSGQSLPDRQHLIGLAVAMAKRFHLEVLIVTLGANGAFIVAGDEVVDQPAPSVVDVIDTVGAGDAFSAVALIGLMADWPKDVILSRCLEFAAAVCTIRGATLMDLTFYRHHLERWGLPEDG